MLVSMTEQHTHELEDGGDTCSVCGILLCPDTSKPVGYDGARYWHLDRTACFLHQWINEDAEATPADLARAMASLADGQEDEIGALFSAVVWALDPLVAGGIDLVSARPKAVRALEAERDYYVSTLERIAALGMR